MSDRASRSAEGEPWWPEFASEYGKTPLRELARRYDTNPRRLRRAAQRSGLADEPESIQQIVGRLGTCSDVSLADELGLTVELIAGARRRRHIPAFKPSKPERSVSDAGSDTRRPARAERTKADRRVERKARYRPNPDEVVVVRRRPGPERASGAPIPSALPAPPAALPAPPAALPAPPPSLNPLGSSRPGETPRKEGEPRRRRRRIIAKPKRSESADPEPPHEPPAPRRSARKRPPAAASEVRIVTAEEAPELIEDLVEELVEELEISAPRGYIHPTTPTLVPSATTPAPASPAPAAPTPKAASAPPSSVPAPSPTPDAATSPAADPVDGLSAPEGGMTLWLATVREGSGSRELVVRASTVVDAARIASARGTIEKLDRAPVL